ncbi:MAG: rRNA maturation RNase YbeY [Burkholderiales bacterium]|nr:rRNA maturation RNase YbeY [Burkholderiales bacterium]
MPVKLVLTLQVASDANGIPSRRKLRAWALAALNRSARVTVRITGAREARMLNRRYRGRDYATNVLTFVYDDATPLGGDIALCAPVVAREAREQAKTLDAHYAHLLVHGMLHLQGYDHAAPRAAAAMEAREIAILARLGYADPYRSVRPG